MRRVEAATGLNALKYVRELEATIKHASGLVKSTPTELPERIERLLADSKRLEKELAESKRKAAMGGSGGGGTGIDAWAAQAKEMPVGKVLSIKVDVPDGAMLREVAEKLRDKLGESVVAVGTAAGPKAMLVVTVSKGLVGKFKAGELIKPIAATVGGNGGGRPDRAQAGGTEVAKLDEALALLYGLVS